MTVAAPDDTEVRNSLAAAHSALDSADTLMDQLAEALREARGQVKEARTAMREDQNHG